jgi:hypothetical protein
MKKTLRFAALAAVLSLTSWLTMGVQARAEQSGEPAYHTTFYSDATYQTEVGYLYPECTGNGIQYHLVGTFTYYAVDDYIVGYCGPYGWEEITG